MFDALALEVKEVTNLDLQSLGDDENGGTIFSNELRRLETKSFEIDWAEAKERLGRDPLIFELSRTPDQRPS